MTLQEDAAVWQGCWSVLEQDLLVHELNRQLFTMLNNKHIHNILASALNCIIPGCIFIIVSPCSLSHPQAVTLPLSLGDGKWHHVCVTWSTRDGQWEAYQDGVQRGSGINLSPWHPIKPGGVFILGQEQVKTKRFSVDTDKRYSLRRYLWGSSREGSLYI